MKTLTILSVFTALFYILILSGCKPGPAEGDQDKGALFRPVTARFDTDSIIIPEGFTYKILFSEERDTVETNAGLRAPAKGSHDFVCYIPLNGSNENGYIYVSHETRWGNDALSDGGGATRFQILKSEGEWKVMGIFKDVNFDTLGGTLNNCGGTLTPHGTVITAEEIYPESNREIFAGGRGFRDTTDVNGLKRYENFGWMVEVDATGFQPKGLRKLYQMGRFTHEDAQCMSDGKTVYLTDDNNPAVFFKFVADVAGDYSGGQLYAYQETDDGAGGNWLELPMQMDSLLIIRDVAMRMGATIFIRHEWIEEVNGKLYITETGYDHFDWTPYVKMGAKPASYFKTCCPESGEYHFDDPNGRILEFDPESMQIRPYLNGGKSDTDPTLVFSNPDGLTSATIKGVTYLIINEDLIGADRGRVPAEVEGTYYNEVYFLDMRIAEPTLNDLKRFMTSARGSETTGSWFTPDGSTYFVSIQHPATDNPPPFNRSCVIAVTGF